MSLRHIYEIDKAGCKTENAQEEGELWWKIMIKATAQVCCVNKAIDRDVNSQDWGLWEKGGFSLFDP